MAELPGTLQLNSEKQFLKSDAENQAAGAGGLPFCCLLCTRPEKPAQWTTSWKDLQSTSFLGGAILSVYGRYNEDDALRRAF